MRCNKCGFEIADNSVVCEHCGADLKVNNSSQEVKHGVSLKKKIPVQEQQPVIGDDGEIYPSGVLPVAAREEDVMPVPQTSAPIVPANNTEKKKKIPYKLIVIAAVCVVALSVGIGVLSHYNSPKEQMYRSIDNGDFEKAYDLYAENFSGQKLPDKLLDVFWNRLDEAKRQFVSKEKDYSETKLEIERVSSMNIDALAEKVKITTDFVDNLNASRTAYSLGNEYLNSGDYVKAMAQFKKVIEDDSDYSNAQSNYKKSVDSYRSEQLEKAANSASSGDIDAAIIVLKTALTNLENDSEFTKQLDIYNGIKFAGEIKSLLLEIDGKTESGDYTAALSLLKTALATYPDNAEVKTKYNDVEGKYVNSVMDEAESLMQSGDYDSALQRLDNAKKVLPDNKTLADKYTTVSNNKPVQLKEIKMQNASDFALKKEALEDIVGNIYPGNNLYLIDAGKAYSDGYCQFYLGGKYTKLTGIIAPESSFGKNSAFNFEIYADDALKYSQKITQKTLATQFEADVSGAEWLTIKGMPISGVSSWYTRGIINNPVLFKAE